MRFKRVVALSCAMMMVFGIAVPGAAYADTITKERLGGEDRYQTAIAISASGWSAADSVILAPAKDANQIDALTVGPLAAALGAPILLTDGQSLTAETKAELARLKAKDVYLTSGSAVISSSLRNALQADGLTIHDLGGADRYATALNIADTLVDEEDVAAAVVVSGTSKADALSVASVAAMNGWPILLTPAGALPVEVADYLKDIEPDKVYIVGGAAVVSNAVASALPGAERLAGDDRYLTNQALLSEFADDLDFSQGVFVANGNDRNHVDSLVSSPMLSGAPLVLHNNATTDATMVSFLSEVLGPKNPATVTALGGTAAISEQTHEAVRVALEQGATPQLEIELVGDGVYAVDVDGTVVNYLVLEVTGDDSGAVDYSVNGVAATLTPVLTNGEQSLYSKLELPAGAATVTVEAVLGGETIFSATKSATAAEAAPELLYGSVRMDFSEFFNDITAEVTDVHPQATSFDVSGSVAQPEKFIAAGTRSGNNYDGNISWAASKNYPAVDAVSSATFGDTVHYIPTGALEANYSGADLFAPGAGHAITGISAVQVGVDFDLLANAEILDQIDAATSQSEAVANKAATISWLDPADTSTVYKAKYLFPDASWGARDTEAVNPAAQSFPTQAAPTFSYGGTWTIRQMTVNFDATEIAAIGAEPFWDDYLEYIYGGYIENLATGEREPLVWLQNLFSHRHHTNFDVSVNENLFSRFNSLDLPGDYKVVVFAEGFEDIVVSSQHLASFINANAAIEQGSTFNINPSDNSTWFEQTVDGYQLHINGADQATLDSFNPAAATLSKGATPVSTSLYSFEQDGPEIAVTFDPSFFSGSFQGSYTIRLVADTVDAKTKPLTFTVNKVVARPTLAIRGGGSGIAADSQASPLTATTTDKIDLSDTDLAKAVLVSGRSISSVVDLSTGLPITNLSAVIKRDSASDPYYLDLSGLTAGHSYQVNLLTANYAVWNGSAYATSVTYFITV